MESEPGSASWHDNDLGPETRIVRANGVLVEGEWYSHQGLAQRLGKTVTVRHDRNRLDRIGIEYDGRFWKFAYRQDSGGGHPQRCCL